MLVAHIGCFSDPQRHRPADLLHRWPSLVDVAEAATLGGADVWVIQASTHIAEIERNGVHYRFLPFGHRDWTVRGRADFSALLRELDPAVVHVHGLGFPLQLEAIAAAVPHTPILVQDHASGVPRFWKRWRWRRALRVASAVAFCSREQAEPFLRSGLLARDSVVREIPESSSRFTTGDRDEARRLTDLDGTPALLWVGHLNHNKDPLAVLDGVRVAARKLPGLRLWCCYGAAPLEAQVRARIAEDAWFARRVRLLGPVPHSRIETLMRAADFFVLGSHHEGSGYALIEALACGLPPVVTDIPSFRSLTADGRIGRLWRCGDSRSLADAIVELAQVPRLELRTRVRAHFDANVSMLALGARLCEAYRDLAESAGSMRRGTAAHA